MPSTGIGTRSSPISVEDSEEEVIQELSYNQFYNGFLSSQFQATRNEDARSVQNSLHQQIQKPPSMHGKRKRQEEDIPMAPSNPMTMSLENRISQPESKNARKRRRRAERLALEQQRLKPIDWLNNPLNVVASGSQLAVPSLHTRLSAEQSEHRTLEEETYCRNVGCHEFYVKYPKRSISPSPPPSMFGSEWVSSMAMAGKVTQSAVDEVVAPQRRPYSPKLPLPPTPVLPPPLPPPPPPTPEILPPIHIHSNLAMSIEPAIQTALQNLPQTIGMNPEHDPNSKHGIFQITESTKEAGAGMKKRKSPYVPNPARTLVMEQLPKTHRTIGFVDSWCRSACGVPPLHLFVDSSSAKALIEFATAELARKAWSSPRLGQDTLKLKSHQLRGKAREDLIKVWWYRVDGIGAGGGVGEIEEGEIEEDLVGEKELPPPPPAPEPPRKETKKERKLRLAKQREQKKVKDMQLKMNSQKSEQKQEVASLTPLNPPLLLSVQPKAALDQRLSPDLPQISALPSFPTAYPFNPILTSVYTPPSWQYPLSQSTAQPQPRYSGPQPMLKTAVGASIPTGVQGGHDDSASIASSDGRSTPLPVSNTPATAASSSKVIASTEGRIDDLADYDEVKMDVDVRGESSVNQTDAPSMPSSFVLPARPQTPLPGAHPLPVHHPLPAHPDLNNGINFGKKRMQHSQAQPTHRHQAASLPTRSGGQPSLNKTQPRNHQTISTNLRPALEGPAIIPISDAIDVTSRVPPTLPRPPTSSSDGAAQNIASDRSEFQPGPLSQDATKQSTAMVRNKLEERIAKSKMELAASALLAQRDLNHIRKPRESVLPNSVSVAPNTPSEVSGLAMEENLRQLVFASKNKIRPAAQLDSVQPTKVSMAPKPSTIPANPEVVPHGEFDSHVQVQSNEADSSNSRESCTVAFPASPNLSSMSDTAPLSNGLSFEDLAVSFITQTIETIKAAPRPTRDRQFGDSLSSAATSVLATPSPPMPATSVLGLSAISTNPVKPSPLWPKNSSSIHAELAVKQRRLEEQIQETKTLMDRISTAKTKNEKDLLFQIMREKTRLFDEETKAKEKRVAKPNSALSNTETVRTEKPMKDNRRQITSSMTLQLQQWPTAQYDAVLILSDDED